MPERAEFTPFTNEEIKAIPLSAHGKILKYIASVNGNWDIALTAVKEYRSYLADLFLSDKEKKKFDK